MTAAALENEPFTDAQLVAASRGGDREAFGRLVRRYQGMVSGMIYAYCGDLHRSEDLAQETFISAWKSLSALREPGKVAPWLYQTARRHALDHLRGAAREKDRLSHLHEVQVPRAIASPAQEALTSEERDLLWRILSELPQPYRETMVLYYRQGQSSASVAEAMETTETAVRQRLTRGRQMLREQVAGTLERNLERSSPSPAFALAVVMALPAIVPQTAKAMALGAVAKGSAATGGSALGTLSTLLGPFVAVAAGLQGFRAGLRGAKTLPERRLIIRFGIVLALVIAVGIVGFNETPNICHHFHLGASSMDLVLSAAFLLYTLGIVALTVWVRRRLSVLRGDALESASPPSCSQVKMPFWMILGMTVGSLGWMIGLAWPAGDTLSVAITLLAIVALTVLATYLFRGRSAISATRLTLIYILILFAFTTAMLNWRFHDWLAVQRALSVAEVHRRLPMWSMNVLIITLFVCAELLVLASMPLRKGTTNSDNPRSEDPGPT
ncbi:MAG: sigma-70 family RNA polymerase sigma factor [Tepidisphaeraceae bacterium]